MHAILDIFVIIVCLLLLSFFGWHVSVFMACVVLVYLSGTALIAWLRP